MFEVFDVSSDVVALYETRNRGSEVLLFKRNVGYLGKINILERGPAVEKRLSQSIARVCGHVAPDDNPTH